MYSAGEMDVRNRAAKIIVQRTAEAGGCFTDAQVCDDVVGCKCLREAVRQARKEIANED